MVPVRQRGGDDRNLLRVRVSRRRVCSDHPEQPVLSHVSRLVVAPGIRLARLLHKELSPGHSNAVTRHRKPLSTTGRIPERRQPSRAPPPR